MSWVSVAVTGVSALNQLQQGRMAKGQADLQAGALDYQAQQAQQDAMRTAEIIRRAGRRTTSAQTAAYAAAGVKVGEGSAAEVERQTNIDVEKDAFAALLEGGRRAGAYRTEATMQRAQGDMAETAGQIGAVNSVLAGGYSAMRNNGWRTFGPGFSGGQMPAPVEDRYWFGGGNEARPNRGGR